MASMQVLWGVGDQSIAPTHRQIRSRLCARGNKPPKEARFREPCRHRMCSATPPLETVRVLGSLMMSVGWSVKGKHYDISRAHFQGRPQRIHRASRKEWPVGSQDGLLNWERKGGEKRGKWSLQISMWPSSDWWGPILKHDLLKVASFSCSGHLSKGPKNLKGVRCQKIKETPNTCNQQCMLFDTC